ncbi:glycosyltransferase family 69 protein, partial [Piromyces sp. E2]
RIKFWIYFNKKEKFLPVGTEKNTTYYLTAMISDIEPIADDYISEMKKIIEYLGDKNVMVSIVENGDSKDNTRDYLRQFQDYLNKKNIPNKFLLEHEVNDPRKTTPGIHNGRVTFYSLLRNKVFDLLYETKDLDYGNTKIIYFNDIVFAYEDIIKLISTNNEDYDSVCAMDFYYSFYDTWVSFDISGNRFKSGFPFFINSEAQHQVLDNKPVRIFSCWNGVIVFTASPLENKRLQFR